MHNSLPSLTADYNGSQPSSSPEEVSEPEGHSQARIPLEVPLALTEEAAVRPTAPAAATAANDAAPVANDPGKYLPRFPAVSYRSQAVLRVNRNVAWRVNRNVLWRSKRGLRGVLVLLGHLTSSFG